MKSTLLKKRVIAVLVVLLVITSAFAMISLTVSGLGTNKELKTTYTPSNILSTQIEKNLEKAIASDSKFTGKIDPQILSSQNEYNRIIVIGKDSPLDLKNDMIVRGSYKIGNMFVTTGTATKPQIDTIAALSTVTKIMLDIKLNYGTPDKPNSDSALPTPDLYNARNILGVNQVQNVYGLNGAGVRVAITDTGTFFGSNDMKQTIARDSSGMPDYLDADGESFGSTPIWFVANVTGGVMNNWTGALPSYVVGAAFVNSTGVFLPTSGIYTNLLNPNTLPYQWQSYKIPYNAKIGISNLLYVHGPTFKWNSTTTATLYAFGYMTAPLISMSYYYYGYGWYSGPIGDPNVFNTYSFTAVPALTPFNFTAYNQVYVAGLNTILSDVNWAFGSTIWPGASPGNFVYSYLGSNYWEAPHRATDTSAFLRYAYPTIFGIYADLGTVGVYTLFPNWTSYFTTNTSNPAYYLGAANGNLLHGINPYYFTIAISTDRPEWHGTFTASVVASRGINSYNLYNNGTYYKLPGIASGAAIVGVTALWAGDVWYGWMWSSGFDYNWTTMTWQYSGHHRAQINSNSWGISTWPFMGMGIGYDVACALENLLMIPGSFDTAYPGTLFVHAMGNGGPGYGTVTTPGGAFLPLSVGASTSFDWIHAFGWGVSHTYGNVIPWSDRGPSYTGDVKPDVVAIGAFSWVPASMNYWDGESWLPPGVGIFGGTSQATPMVAGVAALVVQAMNQAGVPFNPLYVKNVIMSTATDLNNEPFVQGSGQVNAFGAVTYVLQSAQLNKGNQAFITTTSSTYNILSSQVNDATSYWFGQTLPAVNQPLSSWFAGYLNSGASTSTTFTVYNPGNTTLKVAAGTQILSQISSASVTHTWNYTSNVTGFTALVRPAAHYPYYMSQTYVNVTKAFGAPPSGTVLEVVTLTTPMVKYMAKYGYNNNPNSVNLWAANWNGSTVVWKNGWNQNVTVPAPAGTNVVNYAYNRYNTQVLSVSDPSTAFNMTQLLMLRLYNTSGINFNPDKDNYTLNIYYFGHAPWGWVSVPTNTVSIGAGAKYNFTAKLTVPADAANGIYSGYVTVTGANGQIDLIPTSVVVKTDIGMVNTVYSSVLDKYSQAPLYSNSMLYGMGALTWRYESGDVRLFYINVSNPFIATMNVSFTWNDPGTSVDLFAIDPHGFIVASSVPYIFSDYLGGGRFACSNLLKQGTFMIVPINYAGSMDLGMYTIVIHNVNSGGGVWPVNFAWQVQTYGLTIIYPLPGSYINVNGGPYHVQYTTPNIVTGIQSMFGIGYYPFLYSYMNITQTYVSGTYIYDIIFYPIVALSNMEYQIFFMFYETIIFGLSINLNIGYVWNFTINTIPPTLTITSPVNGNVPYSTTSTVLIAGTTSTNTITINGASVSVVNGQFSIVKGLVNGLNTFIVTATDKYGNSVSQTVTVLYLPEIAQIQSQITNISNQISNLNLQISNILTTIANLSGQLTTLQNQVKFLNQTYGVDISNLQSQITTLQNTLNTLKNTVTDHTNKISNASAGISNNYLLGIVALILALIGLILGLLSYFRKPKMPITAPEEAIKPEEVTKTEEEIK